MRTYKANFYGGCSIRFLDWITTITLIVKTPMQVVFDSFLYRLHDWVNMDSYWEVVQYKCSWYSIYPEVRRHWGFEDDNVTYLYTTNKEVHVKNENVVKSLHKPIDLIEGA